MPPSHPDPCHPPRRNAVFSPRTPASPDIIDLGDEHGLAIDNHQVVFFDIREDKRTWLSADFFTYLNHEE